MENMPVPLIAIILAIAALVFFWLARQQKRNTGMPGGRVIYADTQRWVRVERPLYDPRLRLTGKPDYMVEQDGQVIPVEVKSSHRVTAPYDGHIFQLAAYCMLVESSTGKRPDYGILHYPDRTFAVDFTPALEAEVLKLVAEMQVQANQKNVHRSHQAPQRCAHCGYQSICDQSLRI